MPGSILERLLQISTSREQKNIWGSHMDQISDHSNIEREPLDEPARLRRRTWRTPAVGAVTVIAALLVYFGLAPHRGNQAAAVPTPVPQVTVSQPLQREVDS